MCCFLSKLFKICYFVLYTYLIFLQYFLIFIMKFWECFFFLQKKKRLPIIVFFLFVKKTCVYTKITAICFENWLRTCSKIWPLIVNLWKSAKSNLPLTLLVFDKKKPGLQQSTINFQKFGNRKGRSLLRNLGIYCLKVKN